MISLGCTLNTFDINGAYCVQYFGNFFNQAISRPATAIVTFDYGNSEYGTKSKCKPTKVNFNWVWPATERQPSSLVYSIVYTPVDASSVRDPLDKNIKPRCSEFPDTLKTLTDCGNVCCPTNTTTTPVTTAAPPQPPPQPPPQQPVISSDALATHHQGE